MEQLYRVEVTATRDGQFLVTRQWNIKDDRWSTTDRYITRNLAVVPEGFQTKQWAVHLAHMVTPVRPPVVEALEAALGVSVEEVADAVLSGNEENLLFTVVQKAKEENKSVFQKAVEEMQEDGFGQTERN